MTTMNSVVVSEKPWPQLGTAMPQAKCKYVTKHTQLGDGHFSIVKECMNVYTHDRYAMKLVHKNILQGKLQLVQREVALLKKVSNRIRQVECEEEESRSTFDGHHHVLQLFDYFETSKSIVLVTQLCSGGDLYDMIINAGSLDLRTQVKPYTACLLSALEFLHDNGVVHRDIKAENVLFRLRSDKEIQSPAKHSLQYDLKAHDLILADFGLATELTAKGEELKEYVGTISYIAPEIVRCEGINRLSPDEYNKVPKYGTEVDIWALGVLCYFMMCGYMPFDCDTEEETKDCIKKSDYYIDEELHESKDNNVSRFYNFIQRCFTVDACKRPTAHELKHHPFIVDFFPSHHQNLDYLSARPAIKKCRSSSSIHNLEPPSRSSTNNSILHISHREQQRPKLSRGNSREENLNKIRETLKKTLSMTSLAPNSQSLDYRLMANSLKKNSTFKLEPPPPTNSLMNGCYSVTPESRSNFNVSPAMSRNSSTNNVKQSLTTKDTSLTSLTTNSTLSDRTMNNSWSSAVTSAPAEASTELIKPTTILSLPTDEESDVELEDADKPTDGKAQFYL